MALYRGFNTQEELDREYNPTAAVPEAAATFDRWREVSAQVVGDGGRRLDQRFGPTLAEHVDVWPAGPHAPVHVFIHGGYWRRFSARDHAFLAPAINALGATAVIVNYALCPSVTIDEIVRQVRAAIAWTFHQIAGFGGDPDRLTISGHSAGGHLGAMALATDWAGDYGLPADLIKGALLISGLYDLAPFPYTYLQPSLQLDWAQIRRNSPLGLPARATAPVVVAVGDQESAEFKRQSASYAAMLREQGVQATLTELLGNHLSVVDGYGQAQSPLHQDLARLIGGRPAG